MDAQTLGLIVVGLALLAVGGEFVVRGAVGAARKFGVSELMIGLTLVGFGTSSPELAASLGAALSGSPGIAVGNVVGSNISNVLLIFAIVAIIKPIAVDSKALARDGWVMVGATLAFIAIATGLGEISRLVGAGLLLALIAYVVAAFLMERRNGAAAQLHAAESHLHDPAPQPLWLSLGLAGAGLVMLVFGADFLVSGAKTIARAAGLSETIIGLTIVALGTSLPELVTSAMAAIKGRSDVAFGGIVGSNIYNILGILGVTALVQPIAVPADLLARDWAALYVGALLLLLHANTGGKVTRFEGGFLLLHYAGYCWFLLR
ncbi:MAG: sodium:calcium antiporter [Alphaproteobacteria bacterium]|nr:sodium:calcium antiporter [Alphaproteobacteria bacterium]